MPAGKLLFAAAIALAGCGGGRAFVLAERARDVGAAIEAARQNGARRCAPRELALAQAHLDFAQRGLETDDYFGAEDHLRMAESNAIEAHRLSPRERCAHDGGAPATPAGRFGVPSPPAPRPPSALQRRWPPGNNRRVDPVIVQEYVWR
jgi:hypothetical protein